MDNTEALSPGWSSSKAIRRLTAGNGRPVAVVVTVILAFFHFFAGESYWRPVRNMVFDAYQYLNPRQVERLPVVIIDIDEESLAELGQWPWPRTRLAALVEAANQLGALAVGLDMILPEPDRASPAVFASERKDLSPAIKNALKSLPSNDDILAKALRRSPSVLGRAGVEQRGQRNEQKASQTPVMIQGEISTEKLKTFPDHIINIPVLENAAFGRGYLNDARDSDGVVRTAPLIFSIKGKPAPSLAVELLRVASGQNWYTVVGENNVFKGINIGGHFIPTNPDGSIRLYFSPADQRRRVSALALLKGKVKPESLAGKAAIIGVSALGLVDVAAVPGASKMDGTEIHAQIIENINSGIRLIRSSRMHQVELIGLLGAALALIISPIRGRILYSIIVFIASSAAFISVSLVCFKTRQWLVDPSYPVLASAIILLTLLAARFAVVDLKRRELKAALEIEKIKRVRMAGELSAARDIQMGMLPNPEAIQGLPDNIEFYALLEPAGSVGGDLYDAVMIDPDHFLFLVGDVSGKGVPASLFMALSKTLTKSVALRGAQPLDELMISANNEISRENPADLFVTVAACILNVRTGAMDVVIAGHDSPVLIRKGKSPRLLESEGGPPLCTVEDFPYPSETINLKSGDMIIMITDGVTEAHNTARELYGNDRAMAWFAGLKDDSNNSMSPENLCQGLYENVKDFIGDADVFDDITIMAVRFNSPNS